MGFRTIPKPLFCFQTHKECRKFLFCPKIYYFCNNQDNAKRHYVFETMKKLIFIFIFIFIFFALIPCQLVWAYEYTDGSWDDVSNRNTAWGQDYDDASEFSIQSEADFAQFVYMWISGRDFNGKTVKLEKDLELGAHYWPRNADYHFAGTFDGQGHLVNKLMIDITNRLGAGLFGWPKDATIKNLTVASGTIRVMGCAGGIVGEADACTIENCHVLGDVSIVMQDFDEVEASNIGGIVGYSINNTVVRGCTSAANLRAQQYSITPKRQYVGGIVGRNSGTIEDCLYLGSIVDGTAQYGAICDHDNGSLSNNYYYGSSIGGVSYYGRTQDVEGACRAYAVTLGNHVIADETPITIYEGGISVYDNFMIYQGGIYGKKDATINLSITGMADPGLTFAGLQVISGTAALNENTLTIGESDVTVESGGYSVGGLVGNLQSGSISGCTSAATVAGRNNAYAGGIAGKCGDAAVGSAGATIKNSLYYGASVTGSDDIGAVAGRSIAGKAVYENCLYSTPIDFGATSDGNPQGTAKAYDVETF